MAKMPVEVLTVEEAERARALVLQHGLYGAAMLLGISKQTLPKAIALLEVHRLTAETIRSMLARLT